MSVLHLRNADGKVETRGINLGGGYSWPDSLIYTGAVPPHGFTTLNKAGVNITERNVTQAVPVNRCMGIIASQLLSTGVLQPYTLAYDKDNKPWHKPVAPIPDLLLSPWSNCNYTDGFIQMIYSLALFGEVFLLTISRDEMGDPLTLQVLPTPFVEVNEKGDTRWALFSVGNVQALPDADVNHIRLRPRPGALRGASSLQEGALAMALFLAAIEFGLQFFGQGVHSSFMLTTEQPLEQNTVDRIMAKLMVEHSGLMQAHLPMMFTHGLKPEKMLITPDEAQYHGTQLDAIDSIAVYFGLPTGWVGGTDVAVGLGRTMEEQITWFTQTTLALYAGTIAEAFSKMLPKNVQCGFNLNKIRRAMSLNLSRELLALRSGTVMTANEIRREFYDMGPAEGGDDLNAPLASNQAPQMGGMGSPEGGGDGQDAVGNGDGQND